MSPALDALLAELTPPPVPAGLAGRIEAAALATAQEPHLGRARRAAGRDRRGRWRRGLVIGAGAIGLAFSGAVAATLAGLPLPAKMEAVLDKLPLIGRDEPSKTIPAVGPHPSRPHPARQAAAPPAFVPEMVPERPAAGPLRMREIRRLRQIGQRVAARRAAGLPTPRADRIERRLRRNFARRWEAATPAERQRFLEMRRAQIEARRARIENRAPPPGSMREPVAPAPQERIEAHRADAPPVYGPIDPRVTREPATAGETERLRRVELRRERLRALREQRRTVGLPARRSIPPVRREGSRRPTR